MRQRRRHKQQVTRFELIRLEEACAKACDLVKQSAVARQAAIQQINVLCNRSRENENLEEYTILNELRDLILQHDTDRLNDEQILLKHFQKK